MQDPSAGECQRCIYVEAVAAASNPRLDAEAASRIMSADRWISWSKSAGQSWSNFVIADSAGPGCLQVQVQGRGPASCPGEVQHAHGEFTASTLPTAASWPSTR
jgi:hypothetical protein